MRKTLAISSNQAKGVFSSIFCPGYGNMLPASFDATKCFECPESKNCRRKYLRKLRRLMKKYGDILKIPHKDLMGDMWSMREEDT